MKSKIEPHVVTRPEYTRWCALSLAFVFGAPATLAAIHYSGFDALESRTVVPGVALYVVALPLLFKAYRVVRRSWVVGEPLQSWDLRDIWH